MAKKTCRPYSYFDTPAGQDVDKKLLFAMKPLAATAAALSVIDVMMYSHPKTYTGVLGRAAYISVPVIAAGATFVLVQNGLASVQKKDSVLNWFIGGAAAGSIYGVVKHSFGHGLAAAVLLGTLAAIKKDAYDQGASLIPAELRPADRGLFTVNHDYTIMKDIPSYFQK